MMTGVSGVGDWRGVPVNADYLVSIRDLMFLNHWSLPFCGVSPSVESGQRWNTERR